MCTKSMYSDSKPNFSGSDRPKTCGFGFPRRKPVLAASEWRLRIALHVRCAGLCQPNARVGLCDGVRICPMIAGVEAGSEMGSVVRIENEPEYQRLLAEFPFPAK